MTVEKKPRTKKFFEYAGLIVPVDAKDDRVIFAQFVSSNLQSLAFVIDGKETGTVYAVFNNSAEKRYVYLGVPAKTFFKVMAADSVGAAFGKYIVKGEFKFFDEKNK